mgnify:FL=1
MDALELYGREMTFTATVHAVTAFDSTRRSFKRLAAAGAIHGEFCALSLRPKFITAFTGACSLPAVFNAVLVRTVFFTAYWTSNNYNFAHVYSCANWTS